MFNGGFDSIKFPNASKKVRGKQVDRHTDKCESLEDDGSAIQVLTEQVQEPEFRSPESHLNGRWHGRHLKSRCRR